MMIVQTQQEQKLFSLKLSSQMWSRVYSDCWMLEILKKIFDFGVSSKKLLLLKKLHNKYVLFVTEQKLFPTIWPGKNKEKSMWSPFLFCS